MHWKCPQRDLVCNWCSSHRHSSAWISLDFPYWAVTDSPSSPSSSLFFYPLYKCRSRYVRVTPPFTVRPSLFHGHCMHYRQAHELLGRLMDPPPTSLQGDRDGRCMVPYPYLVPGDSNSGPYPGMTRNIYPALLCLLYGMHTRLELSGKLSQEVQDLPGLWSHFPLPEDPVSKWN